MTRSRAPSECPPKFWGSPPVRPLAEKVLRLGTNSNWGSTSVLLISTHPLRLSSRSPPSTSNPELRLVAWKENDLKYWINNVFSSEMQFLNQIKTSVNKNKPLGKKYLCIRKIKIQIQRSIFILSFHISRRSQLHSVWI